MPTKFSVGEKVVVKRTGYDDAVGTIVIIPDTAPDVPWANGRLYIVKFSDDVRIGFFEDELGALAPAAV